MSNMYEVEVGGKQLIIETGRLATQAKGSITVAIGETVVLVTACVSPEPRDGDRFLPADNRLRRAHVRRRQDPRQLYAPRGPPLDGSRPGRPHDGPALRPLFPKGFRNDVQIIITVLSADQENDPDVLATIGASAALEHLGHPVRWPGFGRPRRPHRRRVRRLPDLPAAQGERPRPRSSPRPASKVIMVEAGAKSVSEDVFARGGPHRPRGQPEAHRGPGRDGQGLAKPKMPSPRQGDRPGGQRSGRRSSADRLTKCSQLRQGRALRRP